MINSCMGNVWISSTVHVVGGLSQNAISRRAAAMRPFSRRADATCYAEGLIGDAAPHAWDVRSSSWWRISCPIEASSSQGGTSLSPARESDPEPIELGSGKVELELFLEPTCPFSKRAFEKVQPLLDAVGEDKLKISVR